jgi:hypothetical protein
MPPTGTLLVLKMIDICNNVGMPLPIKYQTSFLKKFESSKALFLSTYQVRVPNNFGATLG